RRYRPGAGARVGELTAAGRAGRTGRYHRVPGRGRRTPRSGLVDPGPPDRPGRWRVRFRRPARRGARGAGGPRPGYLGRPRPGDRSDQLGRRGPGAVLTTEGGV